MTIEVSCGQCQTQFQVTPGSLMVECPQCGVPMVLSESSISSSSSVSNLLLQTESASTVVEDPPASQQDETSLSLPAHSHEESEIEAGAEIAEIEQHSYEQISFKEPVPQKRGVSGLLFFMVLSYASLVTIAFAFYFWMTSNFNPAVLENLPDVEPKKNKNGTVEFQLIPEHAPMPRGHELKLGESRRFGDLIITPMKVTRGPLYFVRYDGAASKVQKTPTDDVFKLWLQFENVSQNFSIKPLGRRLTFKRGLDSKKPDKLRANNFVCRLSEKTDSGHVILLYDLVTDDIWNLQDQEIDRELKPGETFSTYLPSSEEAIDTLSGELVWRVHFRKGFNKKSYRGVTTVFEVRFSDKEITPEGDAT